MHCREFFIACHLIPLDKNPGLRPIGVGKVFRRILASVGSLQVGEGHEAGCEPLTHAIRRVYEEQSAEAVLVDSSNTFSSVNRNAFLHNVEITCSSIARYV